MSQTNWNSLGAFLASKKRQERESTSEESGNPEKETPDPALPGSHEGQIPAEASSPSVPSAPGPPPPAENSLNIPAAAQRPTSKPSSGQPVNHPVNQTVDQSTNQVNQLTTQNDQKSRPGLLVNQSTSQPVNQTENIYKSRRERRLKGIRLPVEKLQHYEEWCFRNNRMDFQDAVERALDWLTSQPVNQLSTLINNNLNNDNKLLRIITLYKTLSKRKDFTERDREAYYEIAHHDEDVIVSLMAATHSRKKAETPINGFRYFTTAIQKATAGREVGQSAPAPVTDADSKTSDVPVAPEDLEMFRKAGGKFEGEV